jgi:hypothetical protein
MAVKQEDLNIVCILTSETFIWNASKCTTTPILDNGTLALVNCSCKSTGYLTVVNDYDYHYKTYYVFFEATIDRINIAYMAGGWIVFFLIMVFVGNKRDA